MGEKQPKRKFLKRILIIGGVLLLCLVAVYFYFATLRYEDTAKVKADFTAEALPFINEFEKDYKTANKKYAEKIIAVTGTVTATEAADTTINIKMADTASGSYIIFAFQEKHLNEAKTLKPGDKATIKGSCSDGVYSEILGTYFISFKRSTLVK
jgi:hypothetical protein